jgi:hypothetical protein
LHEDADFLAEGLVSCERYEEVGTHEATVFDETVEDITSGLACGAEKED